MAQNRLKRKVPTEPCTINLAYESDGQLSHAMPGMQRYAARIILKYENSSRIRTTD